MILFILSLQSLLFFVVWLAFFAVSDVLIKRICMDSFVPLLAWLNLNQNLCRVQPSALNRLIRFNKKVLEIFDVEKPLRFIVCAILNHKLEHFVNLMVVLGKNLKCFLCFCPLFERQKVAFVGWCLYVGVAPVCVFPLDLVLYQNRFSTLHMSPCFPFIKYNSW